MSKIQSLLLFALFAFGASFVAARPQSLQFYDRSPMPMDLSGFDTNMKRFAAGLPPLPPVKRSPTRIDTAKRATISQCAKSGVIEVLNTNNVVTGYISSDLKANQHYGRSATIAGAGTFAAAVFSDGTTTDLNIQDASTSNPVLYLSGMIEQNKQLGDGSSDAEAAILGRSLPTNPGVPPQSNEQPSVNNRDAETAIWTYNQADRSLSAIWVNYAGQTPATTTAYIRYVDNGDDKFYLSASPTPAQNTIAVTFRWSSVNDGCGTN